MCGVVGILNLSDGPAPRRDELDRMMSLLRHRGPDGEGAHLEPSIGLGHTRLSIIDLAGGAQPLSNEDGSVWVSFNGEIFNYVELRQELLARGHVFRTRSDTETLVHLYEDEGLRFLDRLNGQFAIALWDARARRLLLARDRVGILPLFYAESARRLLFASEAKAILADPSVERRLDPEGLSQVLSFWSVLPPRTMFAGVSQVPPGHVLLVENGAPRLQRWWDFSFPDEDGPTRDVRLETSAAELRQLLIDAVRLRLRSDVPVGAYLSGGLDSSILALCIDRFSDAPLRTFSLSFEDEEFDERAYQHRLAASLHSEHSEVRVSRADIAAAFPRTIWHGESTVVRTAPAPLLLLSGLARQHGYKVVLTGEGADEAFGGYDLFREAMVRRFWARHPGSARCTALLDRLYPYLKNSPVAAPAYAQGFFRQGLEHLGKPFFGHVPRWTTTRRSLRFLAPELRERAMGEDFLASIAATLPPEISSWRPLCRDQYLEMKTLLAGYLLSSQGDRVLMASSVEGRFPYLDPRVVDFAGRLPVWHKVMGLDEKHVLKRAFRDLLPPEIHDRPKQPYRAPDAASFFEQERPVDWVAELLSPARLRAAGLFDPGPTAALVEKCRRGKAIGFADNMAFMGALSTSLLNRLFIEPARLEPPQG